MGEDHDQNDSTTIRQEPDSFSTLQAGRFEPAGVKFCAINIVTPADATSAPRLKPSPRRLLKKITFYLRVIESSSSWFAPTQTLPRWGRA